MPLPWFREPPYSFACSGYHAKGYTMTFDVERSYSPAEACELLQLGMTALYARLGDGRLKATKDGRLTRISGSEIARYRASLPEYKPHAARHLRFPSAQ